MIPAQKIRLMSIFFRRSSFLSQFIRTVTVVLNLRFVLCHAFCVIDADFFLFFQASTSIYVRRKEVTDTVATVRCREIMKY